MKCFTNRLTYIKLASSQKTKDKCAFTERNALRVIDLKISRFRKYLNLAKLSDR